MTEKTDFIKNDKNDLLLFRSVRHPGPLRTPYNLSAAALRDGVLDRATGCVKKLLSKSPCSNLLVKMSLEIWLLVPLHNPPQGLRIPSGDCLAVRPGAFLASLGRKLRVPRCLQKVINVSFRFGTRFLNF